MYKDSKRTCTAIVLLIKPFVWRRSRCRRRRVLLKLPNIRSGKVSTLAMIDVYHRRCHYRFIILTEKEV